MYTPTLIEIFGRIVIGIFAPCDQDAHIDTNEVKFHPPEFVALLFAKYLVLIK